MALTLSQMIERFVDAFLMRHSGRYGSNTIFQSYEYFIDIYSQDIGNIRNPIHEPWWPHVTTDMIYRVCSDKPLASFLCGFVT